MALERREDRLEEIARNYMTYDDLTFFKYCENIDEVTSEMINKAASKALKGKPTMLVSGNDISRVPTIKEVERYFS